MSRGLAVVATCALALIAATPLTTMTAAGVARAEGPMVATPKVNAPKVNAPKVKAPKVKTPKSAAPKLDAPMFEAPKVEAPQFDPPKVEAPQVEVPQVYARPERAESQRLGRGCEADFCRPRYAVTATLPLPKTLPDRYEATLTMMKGWFLNRSFHLRDDLALTMLQGDRYFTLTSPWLPTAALSLGPAFAGGGTVVGLRIPF